MSPNEFALLLAIAIVGGGLAGFALMAWWIDRRDRAKFREEYFRADAAFKECIAAQEHLLGTLSGREGRTRR